MRLGQYISGLARDMANARDHLLNGVSHGRRGFGLGTGSIGDLSTHCRNLLRGVPNAMRALHHFEQRGLHTLQQVIERTSGLRHFIRPTHLGAQGEILGLGHSQDHLSHTMQGADHAAHHRPGKAKGQYRNHDEESKHTAPQPSDQFIARGLRRSRCLLVQRH